MFRIELMWESRKRFEEIIEKEIEEKPSENQDKCLKIGRLSSNL
ncbi:hypothetical protein ACT8ZS_03840 [Paenibacillus sp. M.A.Huq-84]